MNRKIISLLLIGFCFSFMALFVTPTQAHGDTSLAGGNVLHYDFSLVQSQDWTIQGRWYNTTVPAVPHYTNFTESRMRTVVGTITVDVLAVRLFDVDLRVTYDLHNSSKFWDRSLNDSLPAQDYTGSWNQTRYPAGPNINETIRYTSYWNYSDSFELEVNKLTRDINTMTDYSASAPLSTKFYTRVSGGDDFCSFWIFPNALAGESYAFVSVGLFLELIGDSQHWTAPTNNPIYEIENTRTYFPPGGGAGLMQTVLVAKYDATLAELTTYSATHAYTVDYKNYVNEFLFDQDTGVLLQYHRSYRVLPFFITNPTAPLNELTDIYNLEFTMTLQTNSNVWLGIGLLETILLCVLIPVGIIAVILIYRWRSHRH